MMVVLIPKHLFIAATDLEIKNAELMAFFRAY